MAGGKKMETSPFKGKLERKIMRGTIRMERKVLIINHVALHTYHRGRNLGRRKKEKRQALFGNTQSLHQPNKETAAFQREKRTQEKKKRRASILG